MQHILWSSSVLTVILLTPSFAMAQQPRPERPSRALFGSGVGDTSQALTASGGLGLGWDSHLAANARGIERVSRSDLARENRGGLGQGYAGLSYQLQRERVAFGATGTTSARYYPSVSDDLFTADYANARGSVALPLSIRAHGSVGYRPYSVAALYPGLFRGDPALLADDDFDAGDPDFATSRNHYTTWTAGVGTGRDLQITRRLRVRGDTTFRTRTLSRGTDQFRTYGGGGTLSYAVTRGFSLKGGYHVTRAEYGERDRDATRHLLDVGADFSRNLSFSRRTTLSFSSGTSAVTHPDNDGRSRFRATGNVDLTHEIGRTWAASVGYGRGVHFIEVWPEPVVSDGVAASFGGLFSRRLRFSSSARASTGRVGFNRAESSGFDTYYGNVSLSYALTRHMGVGARYAAYHHRFSRARVLPPGLSPWVDRHSLSVQVSLWAPLYQQARRADATR